MKRFLAGITLAIAAAAPVLAHEFTLGSLQIAHPWTRQTAPGQSNGGGFLIVTNKGRSDDRLVGVASPAAARTELHNMTMEGGVMRMRPVTGGLPIPAGGMLTLAPGGYHVMLIGLKAPLALGTMVPLTLRFEKAGAITVQLKVEPIGFTGEASHDHH